MNRRLRKKLRLGEFAETILTVEAELERAPPDEAIDAFIEELELSGMMVGGGFGKTVSATFSPCTCGGDKRKRCRGSTDPLKASEVPALLEKHFGSFVLSEWSFEDGWHEGGVYRKRRRGKDGRLV